MGQVSALLAGSLAEVGVSPWDTGMVKQVLQVSEGRQVQLEQAH